MKYLIIVMLAWQFLFSTGLQAGPTITPSAPAVNASSYLLMDHHSGQVLAAHNVDAKLPPASLTKIMTTYVAASELVAGHISFDDEVVVSEKAWRMPGSRMFIEVNNRVSVRELLNGIIIQSGNDASVALAEHVSGDEGVFAELMNQHAARLGLKNSHFTNASGLPHEEHYTTAHDLAILAVALIRDYPEIYALHAEKEFTYNDIRQQNRNRLLWLDNSVDGIKTGHTEEAGYCLVTSAERDGMRLVSVVMGSDSDKTRTAANQALLNYGFRFFETQKYFNAGQALATEKVWKAEQETIPVGVADDLYLTFARGDADKLQAKFEYPGNIIAPVAKGAVLGRYRIMLSEREIASGDLLALEAVSPGGLLKRWEDEIRLFLE